MCAAHTCCRSNDQRTYAPISVVEISIGRCKLRAPGEEEPALAASHARAYPSTSSRSWCAMSSTTGAVSRLIGSFDKTSADEATGFGNGFGNETNMRLL